MANITILAGQTATVTFTVEVQKGTLHIIISGLPGSSTAGGTAAITTGGLLIQTVTIDASGEIFVPLAPGTYDVTYTPVAGIVVI